MQTTLNKKKTPEAITILTVNNDRHSILIFWLKLKFLFLDEKIWSSQTTDLDEFLPGTIVCAYDEIGTKISFLFDLIFADVNESNLSLLTHAGEEAVLLHSNSVPQFDDEKSDEIPSELMPDSLPEIDAQTDSSDDDECLISPAAAFPPLKSSPNQKIEFNIRYFKESSSSSDDDSLLSKGLTFNDYSIVDGALPNDSKKTENVPVESADDTTKRYGGYSIPSMVTDLMSNLTKLSSTGAHEVDKNKSSPKGPDKHESESSDDSEFEILNSDELNVNWKTFLILLYFDDDLHKKQNFGQITFISLVM